MEATNYDSEFCGSIPVTTINSIQSYGFLIVLDKNFIICQVSENIKEFLFRDQDAFIGTSIGDYITEENYDALKKTIFDKYISFLPLYISFNSSGNEQKYIALIHSSQTNILIEFEPHESGEISYSEINYGIRSIAGILRMAKSKSEVITFACKEIKKISGFDRVLIYEFDKSWNGTVVAEEKNESSGFDSYFGLTFPASDIPRQARNLYHVNPFRYIPDINYKPSKLYPEINPQINGHIDLSTCNLRGVVPVHIEYLGNMNMAGSMSIPILKNNELWGIVSCHHRTPRKVNYHLRSSFEIMTSIISSEISGKEAESELKERIKLEGLKNELLKKLYNNDLKSALLNDSHSLLTLLNLSGVSIIYEGKIESSENSLTDEQIRIILQWIHEQKLKEIYCTHQLPSVIGEAATFKDIACGMIVIPIDVDRDEYILGFRPEMIKVRNWGGNPNEAIKYETDKRNYHPRNSFSLWKETVKNTSQPWSPLELEIAENFRHSLIEYILKIQTYKRVIAEEEAFKLSIVANNTTNLVLILDDQRRIEWANAAFLNTLGFTLDAISGMSFTYLFSSFLGIHEINQQLDSVNSSYTPFSSEIVLTIKNRKIYIKFNFSPLLDDKKNLFKYVIVGID
jgi:two-component system, chemotaxis family, sensor kinase Cph1